MKSASGDGGAGVDPGYDALTGGCAVVGPASQWHPSWMEISGSDRARFLHGLVTCDVKALESGQGTYGFFVDAKGKILADVVVSALADRLLLELPDGKAPEIRSHLERFIVADQVELKEVGGVRSVLAGPGARDVLLSMGASDAEPGPAAPNGWATGTLELAGENWLVRGERRLGVEAWIVRSLGDSAAEAFLEAAVKAGAVEASMEDLEAVRIERGIARAGVDFGEAHFPQETGLEEQTVSYTKGCYLGQEVVARIHYRGKVNHALRGLIAESGVALPTGTRLEDAEGNEAGQVTSATRSRALGRSIGLSILHRRFAEAGTRLELASRGSVTVVELPFETRE